MALWNEYGISNWIVLLISTFALLYLYVNRKLQYWKSRGVTSPTFTDLLRNFREILTEPLQDNVLSTYRKYGRLHGTYMGVQPNLSVADPVLLKQILVKDFHVFHNRVKMSVGDPVFDKILTILQDDDWKRIRTIISPTFSSSRMRKMAYLVRECSEKLAEHCEKTADKGEVDCKKCGPCHRMAPIYEDLSRRYTKAVFLKVDVDQCTETATSQGISAMPTFNFFRNKIKLAQVRGADAQSLENKIKELSGADGDEMSEGTVHGHIDLITFINKSSCECLNESDDHTFAKCLSSASEYLESDCDEQLIISIGFTQAIKLHSIKVQGPQDSGPKVLKLFINHPRTLDFDQSDSMEPVQTLELQPNDLTDDTVVPVRYVKFQNVQNLQIFVKNNQGGTETTRIDSLTLYGSPIVTTNMGDFKRIAGKKGESH